MLGWGKFKAWFIAKMMKEPGNRRGPLCDYERLKYELRTGDVLLMEGRSRVSGMVKLVTQSPWSHAALYIGKIHDIDSPILKELVLHYYNGSLDDHLLIESMLGKGTVVTSLEHYNKAHIRVCRPSGITSCDARQVIEFAIGRLGMQYGIRQNVDLARLLFPWSILPRRWRSSLFRSHSGTPTEEICSSMIAEAFNAVDFPILPVVKKEPGNKVRLFRRNPNFYTPRDFDYSPYFDIIKFPYLTIQQASIYRKLPWEEGLTSEHEELQTTAKNTNDIDIDNSQASN